MTVRVWRQVVEMVPLVDRRRSAAIGCRQQPSPDRPRARGKFFVMVIELWSDENGCHVAVGVSQHEARQLVRVLRRTGRRN